MKARAKHKETKQLITLKIEPSILDELDNLAELSGIDRSKLIRNFISDGLADNEDFTIKKFSDETLKEIHDMKNEIHKIGININQIAKHETNIKNLPQFCKNFKSVVDKFENTFADRLKHE